MTVPTLDVFSQGNRRRQRGDRGREWSSAENSSSASARPSDNQSGDPGLAGKQVLAWGGVPCGAEEKLPAHLE